MSGKMIISQIRFSDSEFILNSAKIAKGVANAARHDWGKHRAPNAGTEMQAYEMPQESRRLADDKFADLNEVLRAMRGKQLIFRQTSGDFIPGADMVRAAMGEQDVWAKWVDVETDALAKRVCIVIDTNTPAGTHPEVTASRIITAIGLTIALETAGVQVQVVALGGCAETWAGRDDTKAFQSVYVPKDYDMPFCVSNFGSLMDTDMSRMVSCIIAWSMGKQSTGSGIYIFPPTWEEIDNVSEGADQVFWLWGGSVSPIGDKPAYVHDIRCFRVSQVEETADALLKLVAGEEAEMPSDPERGRPSMPWIASEGDIDEMPEEAAPEDDDSEDWDNL